MLCCGSVKRRRAAAAFVVCVFVSGGAALLGPAHAVLQVQLCGVVRDAIRPWEGSCPGNVYSLRWRRTPASTTPMFLQRKRLHVQLMLSVYVHI